MTHSDIIAGIADGMRSFYVYILASQPRGTLYIGVTNDLPRRIFEHRNASTKAFTRRYRVHRLVHYESYEDALASYEDALAAIQREKPLKRWPRQWKINLIERSNPDWIDLTPGLGP